MSKGFHTRLDFKWESLSIKNPVVENESAKLASNNGFLDRKANFHFSSPSCLMEQLKTFNVFSQRKLFNSENFH